MPFTVSPLIQKLIACLLVIILAGLHARSRKISGTTQTGFTAIKIVLITAFILAAFLLTASPQTLNLMPSGNDPKIMGSVPYGVALIYVSFAYTLAFLYAAPVEALRDKVEIGYIAAENIFGETGGRLVGAMLALLLISTVSAMTLAGPRALHAIGEDYRAMSWLGRSTADGVPWAAILFQSGIAVFFILTQTFDEILVFAGAMRATASL